MRMSFSHNEMWALRQALNRAEAWIDHMVSEQERHHIEPSDRKELLETKAAYERLYRRAVRIHERQYDHETTGAQS